MQLPLWLMTRQTRGVVQKREELVTISHVLPLVASESAIVPIRSVGRISAIDGFPKESHARCGQPLGFPHPPRERRISKSQTFLPEC